MRELSIQLALSKRKPPLPGQRNTWLSRMISGAFWVCLGQVYNGSKRNLSSNLYHRQIEVKECYYKHNQIMEIETIRLILREFTIDDWPEVYA